MAGVRVVIGVDGGATSTVCCAAAADSDTLKQLSVHHGTASNRCAF